MCAATGARSLPGSRISRPGSSREFQAKICRGASGPASAQYSVGDDAITAIGDAAFARDALASQGLATGFSDALKAVAQPEQSLRLRIERQKAIALHAARVAGQIESSAFRSSKPWIEYAQFLSEMARPAKSATFALAEGAS